MQTWLKIVLGVLVVAVVLIAAMTIAVAVLFDPNDYRDYLISEVEDSTGRTFKLDGDLNLNVFPCCSVGAGHAELGNPPAMPAATFARFDTARFSLDLWPLLTRRVIRIGEVRLDGLQVNLLRLEDGRVNWEFDTEDAGADADADSAAFDELSVDEIVVRGAQLRYQDLETGSDYLLSDLDLKASEISVADNGDVALEVEVTTSARDQSDGTTMAVSFASTVSVVGDRVQLSRPVLDLAGTSPLIDAEQVTIPVRADELGLEFGETNRLTARAVQVNLAAKSLQPLDDDVQADAGIDTLALDLDTSSATLEGLVLSIGTKAAQVQVNGAGSIGDSGSKLQGRAALQRADLRAILTALGAADSVPEKASALTTLTGTFDWTLGDDEVFIKGIQLKLDESTLTGSANVKNFESPAIGFALELDQLTVDDYLPAASTSVATGATEPTPLPLGELEGLNLDGTLMIRQLRASGMDVAELRMSARETDNRLALNLAGTIAGGSFTLSGAGDVAAAEPILAGQVAIKDISPRQILKAAQADPVTADPAVLQNLAGNADWSFNGTRLALGNMRWRLDGTTLTGSAAIDDLDTLAAQFDVTLDRMNVDAYLPPDEETETETEPESEIPVELIRDLRLSGRARAGELVIAELVLGEVDARVTAADGVLRLAPVSARLYGGTYQGQIVIDATGPNAKLDLAQKLDSVQVSDLIGSLFESDRLGGSLTLDFSGTASGNRQTDIIQALTGALQMTLTDGVYRGMNVGYEVERARALLKKEASPPPPAKNETPIRAMSMNGTLRDGTLQTNDLTAQIPHLRLAGAGGLNLVDLALDYRLNAQILKTDSGADASSSTSKALADIAGATVPLTIKGPLDGPKIGVDMKGLVSNTIRDEFADRARQALQKRLGGDAEETPPADGTPEETPAAEPAKKESTRDLLKRGLRDLLSPPPTKAEDEPQ